MNPNSMNPGDLIVSASLLLALIGFVLTVAAEIRESRRLRRLIAEIENERIEREKHYLDRVASTVRKGVSEAAEIVKREAIARAFEYADLKHRERKRKAEEGKNGKVA